MNIDVDPDWEGTPDPPSGPKTNGDGAGALGFTGAAGAAMGIAKFLFFAAIIIAVVLFLLGMTVYKKVT